MKTTLWAALTANGNYARSSAENPPKPETLDDFAAHVRKAGNFVVGRRTFEAFNTAGAPAGNPFGEIDIVVVSQAQREIPGATCVSSPQEALSFLERRGHETALLAGGESLHNAFLAQDLVDELVFNVVPTLEGKGLNVLLPEGQNRELQLQETKPLGNGIIQQRYAIAR